MTRLSIGRQRRARSLALPGVSMHSDLWRAVDLVRASDLGSLARRLPRQQVRRVQRSLRPSSRGRACHHRRCRAGDRRSCPRPGTCCWWPSLLIICGSVDGVREIQSSVGILADFYFAGGENFAEARLRNQQPRQQRKPLQGRPRVRIGVLASGRRGSSEILVPCLFTDNSYLSVRPT